jgi:hypothetical protein
MSGKVRLEWTFSPEDYFEEPLLVDTNDYTLEIVEGRAIAVLSADRYDQNEQIREGIHEHIRTLFLGVQVVTYQAFKLSGPSLHRVDGAGRDSTTVFLKPAALKASVGTLGIKATDAAGRVIVDTRSERVSKKRRLAELASSHRPNDSAASALLDSYGAAIDDPDNEFIHLFEIEEALACRFKGEEAAYRALQISRSRWKRLRILANVEPVRQGRHRGQHLAGLRDATPQELEEARLIARELVEAYLSYLEGNL